MGRISQAFGAFFAILFSGHLPEELAHAFGYAPKPTEAPQPAAPPPPQHDHADGALQLLGILQRDARLLDFLLEDLTGIPDDQVGAAVREMHRTARESLQRYVTLGPVLDGVEGTRTTLPGALVGDVNAVKLLGRVPPDGKAKAGILTHRGWKATQVSLPAIAAGQDVTVVAPAQLEIE